MHLEAHAGIGWTVGALAPGSDRLLRGCCLAGAVIPDVDAVAFLWGPEAYVRWHHTFGHNVFLGLLVVVGAVWLHRERSGERMALAGALVAVCFGSQLLTDAWFTRYPVYAFWPLSRWELVFEGGVGLGAPVNTWLAYLGLATIPVVALVRGVTPVELVSPGLDRLILGSLGPRRMACSTCESRCRHACDGCGEGVCMRHGSIRSGFRVVCPGCGQDPADPGGEGRGAA